MKAFDYLSKDILKWRREQLELGGQRESLDWLLDLAGGLRWSELQSLFMDENKFCVLVRSLEELSILWHKHLQESIPLQYLVGICPWRDFQLEVSSAVMIPRQETELLVDFAVDNFKNIPNGRWADLGTGSGALAIALARELPTWKGHVVEISKPALALAQKNLQLLGGQAKYSLHLGSWWQPLRPWWGTFDLVLSNPPYIPSGLIPKLEKIVAKNEPNLALSGGEDGLCCLREIMAFVSYALAPGGVIMIEHHYDQSNSVLTLMKAAGLINIHWKKDLQGIKRFAIGSKSKKV